MASPAQEKTDPDDSKWEALKERCSAAGLKCQLAGKDSFRIGIIHMSEEGSDRPPFIVWKENLSEVLGLEFEKYRLINGYHGLCSKDDQSVEAFLEAALVTASVESVFNNGAKLELPVKLESGGVAIEFGSPSQELVALAGDSDQEVKGADGTAIKITGIDLDGPGAPKALLERYANALLLQFDTKFQQPIVLSRRQRARLPFPVSPGSDGGELIFPSSDFDHEPMALYWYGRGAHGLPLLEFFAYYQILEFYYEHYVDSEGRRRIAQVLKDPGFSPHDDRHVSRVLRAAGRGSGNRRTERDQLLTTIRGCADAAEIRSYISEDKDRKKFFEQKDPKLTQKALDGAVSDTELLQQLADRIYDLRCKIVHTKEGGPGDGVELLLPHSPEAERLKWDIDLLRLIARQALRAASRPIV